MGGIGEQNEVKKRKGLAGGRRCIYVVSLVESSVERGLLENEQKILTSALAI